MISDYKMHLFAKMNDSKFSIKVLLLMILGVQISKQQNDPNDYMKREHSLIRPYLGKYGSSATIHFCYKISSIPNNRFRLICAKLGILRKYISNQRLRKIDTGSAISKWGSLESSGK